jgi:gas vesicle structural protein
VLIDAANGGRSLVDVLDRVLDKGIVVDAWVRVALVGIDLVTIEARVIVASFETYLRHADHFALAIPGAVTSARVRSR